METNQPTPEEQERINFIRQLVEDDDCAMFSSDEDKLFYEHFAHRAYDLAQSKLADLTKEVERLKKEIEDGQIAAGDLRETWIETTKQRDKAEKQNAELREALIETVDVLVETGIIIPDRVTKLLNS